MKDRMNEMNKWCEQVIREQQEEEDGGAEYNNAATKVWYFFKLNPCLAPYKNWKKNVISFISRYENLTAIRIG